MFNQRASYVERTGSLSQEEENHHRIDVENSLDSFERKFPSALLKRFIESVLFILDLDPFLIYKGNFKHSNNRRYRIYLSPELQQTSNYRDEMRTRFGLAVHVVIGLLATDYMIISVVQILFSILIQNFELNPTTVKYCINLGTHVSSRNYSTSTTSRRTLSKTYETAFEWVDKYCSVLAGPLWSLTGASILLQSTIAVTLIYGYIVLPKLNKTKPLDNVNLRFILNPAKEIQRIDLKIGELLTTIFRESSRNILVSAKMTQTSALRPPSFSVKRYNCTCLFTWLLIITLFLGIVVYEAASFLTFYYSVKRDRCGIRPLDQCGYSDIFSEADTMFLVLFFTVSRWLANVVILMLIVNIYGNLFGQYLMAKSVKTELMRCLRELSSYITNIECSLDNQLDRERSFRGTGGIKLFDSTSTHHAYKVQGLKWEREIEESLLTTYIRTIIAGDEIRTAARLVTQHLETFLVLVCISIFLIFMTNKIGGFESRFAPMLLLLLIWLGNNPILIGCAFVFSRTIELEKTAWSILAELGIYNDLIIRATGLQPYYFKGRLIDLLAKRWRKLVQSHSLSNQRNSIRPFGISLNHQHVLQVNFLVITLASLTRFF